MTGTHLLFRFKEAAVEDVEETLLLGVLAAEGLIGRARLRLEFRYATDPDRKLVIVDATAPGGAIVASIFANLLFHEIGGDAFTVRRSDACGGDQ